MINISSHNDVLLQKTRNTSNTLNMNELNISFSGEKSSSSDTSGC